MIKGGKELISMQPMDYRFNNLSPIRALVVFNPISGIPTESPAQLVEILTELQAVNIHSEVYLVNPESDLSQVALSAVRRGIRTVVACGGDGTIDSVMGGLVGTRAALGIIPVGTQNNIARTMGIPLGNIRAAVEMLRGGYPVRVDVGFAQSGNSSRYFLETATVGLISALFPVADDIQHGNIARIGDLLATLVSAAPSQMTLNLDAGRKKLVTQGHVALVTNMPMLGMQFHVAPDVSYDDGKLDVVVFSNLNKLDLLGVAVQIVGGVPQDPRIQHFRARNVVIETDPKMPILADGFTLGEGELHVTLRKQALTVMADPRVAEVNMPASLPEPQRQRTSDYE